MSDSSDLDAHSTTMVVFSTEDTDITGSSVDDVMILSNLTKNETYAVRCKANLTLSATTDPISASPLADPPYITEVVLTRDVKLTICLERLERRVRRNRLRVHWCLGM